MFYVVSPQPLRCTKTSPCHATSNVIKYKLLHTKTVKTHTAYEISFYEECHLEVQINEFLRRLPVAVAFFSIKTFMKMPNGSEKKCQAADNRLRNESLENIPVFASK